jgi:pyrimidine-nucleoside phosphorylase
VSIRVVDLLRAVRDGVSVAPQHIREFVVGATDSSVPDYQIAAFLMAVVQRGLSAEATVALTLAMRDSGRVLRHPRAQGPCVDKHSTGGVGDKISIPLAPLVACMGLTVPMVSGRGLGHTGGTLDKLESIPGFRVDLDSARFQELVATLGVCLVGQSADLAPADRKLYALRDVTATVESVPLITASILSKKLAEGIEALVLDVKVGRGAFMKTLDDARALARSLVTVGGGAGIAVTALLTDMEQPLGVAVGNALEIRESIAILRGDGPMDSTDLTVALAVEMLRVGGLDGSEDAVRRELASGRPLAKLAQVIEAQGGNPRVVDDLDLLPATHEVTVVEAPRAGVVTAVDAYELGLVAMRLGAGRSTADDRIDPAVGLEILAKVGETVSPGQPLLRVHHRGPVNDAAVAAGRCVVVGDAAAKRTLVLERVQG